jgi:hypothetical protein
MTVTDHSQRTAAEGWEMNRMFIKSERTRVRALGRRASEMRGRKRREAILKIRELAAKGGRG